MFWSCYAAPYPPTSPKFFCVLYWKYDPKKKKNNSFSKRFALDQLKIELCAPMDKQIKLPMASTVGYIFSRMSQSSFSRVLVHKMPKIFMWNASLKLISHHLPWKRQSTHKLQNSIPLRYTNKIKTKHIKPLWEMMLMLF